MADVPFVGRSRGHFVDKIIGSTERTWCTTITHNLRFLKGIWNLDESDQINHPLVAEIHAWFDAPMGREQVMDISCKGPQRVKLGGS